MARFSPAFRLVAACCRWPAGAEDEALVTRLAGDPRLDWPRVLAVAKRHRVEGLVHNALTRAGAAVPDPIGAILTDAAARIARFSLVQAAEAARIARALDEIGAEPVVLKGAAVAIEAYGTLALKYGSDIDLAVRADRYDDARAALAGCGYDEDPADPMIPEKHGVWHHTTHGHIVELHHLLTANPRLLAGIAPPIERRIVDIGSGLTLPTLMPDAQLAFLAVHGAAHGWSRLKWLADFTAVARQMEPAALIGLAGRAVALGAGRCVAQGLLLANELLGLRLDPDFHHRLRSDATTRLITAVARGTLSGTNETVEAVARPFSSLGVNASHLLLMPGFGYVRSEIARKFLASAGGQRGAPPVIVARWLRHRYRLARAARAK